MSQPADAEPLAVVLAIDGLAGVLADAPARLRALGEAGADARCGSSWTRRQELGHLVDSALNNLQRCVRLRSQAELRFPGYDADRWVADQDHRSRPWAALVVEWEALNRNLLHLARGLRPPELAHVWVEGGCTLAWMLVDYLRHLRHHLERIERGAPA